eukprot:CAMPEP_0182947272 /NCGR_PEP_ID=MMETSP0105_2-20130417/58319_1 /TAXON_ID=81532 ORGANISM="Acanthoeca-like sp., Strain 10tr" /NCGR_SAMPLE_ID=MMETSP0105_2 /ASSEMBLY_ACC=CAM_ASM_000205 /LENGTH=84 /DNA_ID=CAMNT_0025087473 /DNA_START=455 /DNA_END=709 /DNA_ORIENTATION=+
MFCALEKPVGVDEYGMWVILFRPPIGVDPPPCELVSVAAADAANPAMDVAEALARSASCCVLASNIWNLLHAEQRPITFLRLPK